jgi:hypothetical protein
VPQWDTGNDEMPVMLDLQLVASPTMFGNKDRVLKPAKQLGIESR